MQDFRYAVRALRKSPGFTIASVATLALAIGANTAMFSVLDAVLLRPLPYRAPEQLVMLWTERPTQHLRESRSAYVNVEAWRRHSRSFADMAVLDPVSLTLTGAGDAEQISGVRASPNVFSILGVQAAQGRTFSHEEAEQRMRVAVISHRFWQTRFGGSPSAIGATITLDALPSRIVGVLPADFHRAMDADVWEPHTLFPDWDRLRSVRGAESWEVIGRLRPHVTIDRAQAEMTAIARRVDEELGVEDRQRGISVVPFSLHLLGSRSRLALWMLAGAVCCVLLIAAANVASLSLARSLGRARELAVRVALGASATRIARQLFAESLTLAALSGLLGTWLAVVAIRLIRAFGPRDLPRLGEADLDLRVLGWALAISCVTGILIGLAPAITSMRRSARSSGDEGGRSITSGIAARRIRRALVVAECALAIVLLVGAGLLIRSWLHIERVDPGFRPDRVLLLQLATPHLTSSALRTDFYRRVLEQVEPIAGVEHAAVIGDLFIGGNAEQIVTIEGSSGAGTAAVGAAAASPSPSSMRLRLRRDEIDGAFFATVGTPLLRGRLFSDADGPDAPRVAIVNEAMASRLWAGRDPIGQRFKLGAASSRAPWFTVVGVAGDMRRQGLEHAPIPQMFEPLAQNPSGHAVLLVRTALDDSLSIVGTLRAAVRRVDARAPVYRGGTLDQHLGGLLAQRRFQTSLAIGFSIVALLMAIIGIYGLVQYSIVTRTHEIGIRMAIGAEARDIFRMVVREGLTLTFTGLGLGLVGALWVGRAGSSLLFGVTATDPLTFLLVSLLLIVVSAAASYLPARRAMNVDPIIALRRE